MSLFSENLRKFRMKHGLIQRELADIAGIKIRAYQLYEQGKTEPSIDVLIKFADTFEVSIDELVGRDFTPKSHEAFAEDTQTNPPKHPSV